MWGFLIYKNVVWYEIVVFKNKETAVAEEAMKGRLFLHYEQGYEGPPWAFQEEKHIHKDGNVPGGEKWDYDGLHILELGDHLKVTTPDDKILFEGVLIFGGVSKSLDPFWYPKDISRKKWKSLFDTGGGDVLLKSELTPVAPKRVCVAVARAMPGDWLVHIESFEDYTTADNMMSEIFTYIVIVAKYFPNRKKPSRFQLYFIPRRSRCGCQYKKEGHVCICDRLPEDILSSIKPL